jgi:glycosyltransferase involved in cell wall biosynthesis
VKIGIHNEPSEGGVGGSEISVARLAAALSADHAVEIVYHKHDVTREKLSHYSGSDLSAVSFRYVEPEAYSFGTSHIPWRRYQNARRWRESLSAPYDLFISFVHGVPAFCHAPRGVLTVLFPFDEPAGLHGGASASPTHLAKRAYHRWEWKRRLAGYQQRVAISEFAREWARRRWNVECEVIHPPVDTKFDAEVKVDLILSVGRFATRGHSKNQLEMLDAFNSLSGELRDWEYFCVGAVDDSASARAYVARARSIADGRCAHVLTDIDRTRLKQLYQRSKIFWHAAGYGEDEEKYPERSEHFGIATVEAMAAGCVPIVINKGGQRDIVQHGANGFLWNSLEEMREYTLRVARDDHLRTRMSAAARERAQRFSTERFIRAFAQLVAPRR